MSGSSRVLHGATEIVLASEGVCRDVAHLLIALAGLGGCRPVWGRVYAARVCRQLA